MIELKGSAERLKSIFDGNQQYSFRVVQIIPYMKYSTSSVRRMRRFVEGANGK
ncbi:hypothetical protein [Mesorhizobium sp. B4-1-3]|uniref:hypothetical protein n=1 Tax=Mesorhizobium sp. B4-1-3 TaxID=2589889 RepID=UPI0015E3DA16|nr:hypothetical protein [Mesorhizobium sp. B4-1-3]